jgi:exopolysaccharide biosynthesis polyprenyl glycosylphosphotransferase
VQLPFASVATTGRPDAARPAEQAERRRLAALMPSRESRRTDPERLALVTTDVVVLVALSVLAGSTGIATLTRTCMCMVLYAAAGLYRPRLFFSPLDDVSRILLCVIAVLPFEAWSQVSTLPAPRWFNAVPVVWPGVMFAGVVIGRAIAYKVIHEHRRRRAPGTSTLVIGSGSVGARVAEILTADSTFGLAPIGLVGPRSVTGEQFPVPLLGSADDVDAVIAAHRPAAVVVTFPGPPDADLVGTLRECRRLGITVFVVPRLFELAVGRVGVELVHGVPLMRMGAGPGRAARFLKRSIDVAGAAAGLMMLAPVLLACALAVRIESSRAKVIFRQERIGQGGRPFTIMKFRSLTPSSDLESQVRWNINNDARVGRIGRLLRNSSLDELPQLLNVLRGDMSLVGPRPERPFFVEQFRRTYTGYGDRHRMPVGLTGWAQIHGLRGDTSIEERVRFDNYYIENWSLALDLKIMARTAGSMLSIHRK